jgi:N-acetylmuramoyl-L-alanine amidase
MTIINSFLQKRKLREFSLGVYMVFVAYVMSFLLLVIGSDSLYNIRSKADGMSTQSDEVNQIVTIPVDNEYSITPYSISTNDIKSYMADAQVDYRQDYHQKPQQVQASAESDDTNWLLGYAMNDEEYNHMMYVMNENDVFDKKEISSFSSSTSTPKALAKSNLLVADKSNGSVLFTKEEINMLEQIVEAEATGEDIIGKILVANVIFNRMADDEFPDNIKDVIFHKVGDEYQFSPISDKRFWSVKITEDTKEAVRRAINGEDYSEGALFFMARRLARKSSAKWFDNNLEWLFKHGEHEFFR